jgi:hypothetical protein
MAYGFRENPRRGHQTSWFGQGRNPFKFNVPATYGSPDNKDDLAGFSGDVGPGPGTDRPEAGSKRGR